MKKYKVIAEGDFSDVKNVIPAIAFVSHNRENRFRATIIIEEIEEPKEMNEEIKQDMEDLEEVNTDER